MHAGAFLPLALAALASAQALPLLTCTEQILQPAEAVRCYLVRIRAVVTAWRHSESLYFVHDPTGGIYLQAEGQGAFEPGDLTAHAMQGDRERCLAS